MNPDDLLRQSLTKHATAIAAGNAVPPAAVMYLRAERHARHLAAERAVLPLRIMQGIGVLAGIIACVWLLHLSPSQSASPILLICAVSAILLVIVGCWTMVRASRTN